MNRLSWRWHPSGCVSWRSSAALLCLPLGGCSVNGAPSFALFGAFFPGWMFCATLGILVAIGARVAFVTIGWVDVLPYQLCVCTAIGLIIALLAWLLFFGPWP